MLQEPLPIAKHQKLYGYNFQPIKFPFKDDPEFQAMWLERLAGNYNFPDELIAEYKEGFKCIHERPFSESNNNLCRESTNIVLYTELGEKVFNIPVFARRSLVGCKCLQRLDGTKFGIWNLGQGRFIDFTLLYSYLQKWVNSGLKIFALFKSIRDTALSCGISNTLTYDDLHRAICGFMNNLEIDYKKAFSCPTHGNSPTWIVSDGKNLGPLKRRVDHLKELDRVDSDDKVLGQSTKSKDRVFLNSKKERMLVCQLLTGDLSMIDFAEISDMTSSNGLLVVELVRHVLERFPDEMPPCYKHFIGNVCKPTSVRGLLQVLTPEPLQYLEQYCKEELNLRIHSSQQQLHCISVNLPAIWPSLDAMCNLDNSVYLPKDVAAIMIRLLQIR